MAAKLTWNKLLLANSLAQSNPNSYKDPKNLDYYNSLNPEQKTGFDTVFNSNVAKGTDRWNAFEQSKLTYWWTVKASNPLVDQASDINKNASTSWQDFIDWMAGKVWNVTWWEKTYTTNGVTVTQSKLDDVANRSTQDQKIQIDNAYWTNYSWTKTTTTNVPTPVNYDNLKNQAYDEYGNAIKPDAQTQAEIDKATEDLKNSYWWKTIEQAYNEMRTSQGVWDVEKQLQDTNALIRTNQQWQRNAQEQNFESSWGMMWVEQLRARNSRDFIRNLSDLSNIQANTVDKLNAINSQIDTVLKLRQTDRANTQADLKAKIELLSNKITPAEKELLKAKLDAKIKSIETKEQAEADRIKTENNYKIQRNYTAWNINSTDPTIKNIWITNAVTSITDRYKAYPWFIQRSNEQIVQAVNDWIASWKYKDVNDAIQKELIEPIQAKWQYQDILDATTGQNSKYEYKPIQTTDTNGNLITTGYMAVNTSDPTDYKMIWVDSNGMPDTSWTSWTSSTNVPNTGWWQDLTSQIDAVKWKDTNIWKYTNNPWNIMGDSEAQRNLALKYWAIWFYKSKNGRTYAVFSSMQDWQNAMSMDIDSKMSWWSSWATWNITLADFAKGWTNWPSGKTNPWATNNMVKYLNSIWVKANANSTIWNIWSSNLMKAIQFNEWTLWAKGQDWSNISKWWTSNTTTSWLSLKFTDEELKKWTLPSNVKPWYELANIFAKDVEIYNKKQEALLNKPAKTWWYSINDRAVIDQYLTNPSNADNIKALMKAWLSTKDIDLYKSWTAPLNVDQKTDANELLKKVNELLSHPWLNSASWIKWMALRKIPETDAYRFNTNFNNFTANQVLKNLGVMKWALSDNDVKMIKEASTNLNLNDWAETVKQKLNALKQLLTKKLQNSTTGASWKWRIN